MRSARRLESHLSTDSLTSQRPYTWADHITACLFVLAALAGSIMVIQGLSVPDQGIISGLAVVRGGAGSSCTTVGRVTSCRDDVDLDDLSVDDAFGSVLNGDLGLDDLVCHRIEFSSPGSWCTGEDCVSEEVLLDLGIGDQYPPASRETH